jgi:hypothetical protein
MRSEKPLSRADLPRLGQRADMVAKQAQSLAAATKHLAALLTAAAARPAMKLAQRPPSIVFALIALCCW